MRGRSSAKHGKELGKSKLKEEPQLSGAYIRSLVKQLTSSKTKDPKSPGSEMAPDGRLSPPDATKSPEALSQNQPQPSQHKKKVRRRLHTSRPYQERLLNMAEARREIVTALKFHRAAMKQASEQQQQQLQLQPPIQPPRYANTLDTLNSSRYPGICPSSNLNADPTTILEFPNYSYNNYYCYPSYSAPFSPSPSTVPLPLHDNYNLPLPNQLLGLNLNLKDFGNIETSSSYHIHNENYSNSANAPSSSSSSSLSSPNSACAEDSMVAPNDPSLPGGRMHQAMDEEEMAEIRSIGEQHEVEWNDTLNLVTSAWWFKFLKTMESGSESHDEWRDEYGFPVFDDVTNIPAWLNGEGPANGTTSETSLLKQQQFFDNDLPSLDIGEIECMDGDWLA